MFTKKILFYNTLDIPVVLSYNQLIASATTVVVACKLRNLYVLKTECKPGNFL